MKRSEVEHVLRAAAAIAQETSFVVVGSQAILMAFPHAPEELLASRELDLYPSLHPEKADLIDGAIGAMSSFDQTFGYHADGVGPETAVMPGDWHTREKLYYVGDVTVICPEVHDLAVSKCVAGRDKDADFVRALFKHGMIELGVMVERIAQLDATKYPVSQITQWTQRRAQEAGA
ncbi:MAG: hypothetical protein Q7S97_12160 [Polaromonas sp.]|nr:hypothetical protein [Burkholderiales bacterium]MDO8441932.1 hypothetical protein [Polaromonas sp.]